MRIVLAGFLGEYSVAELCCVSIADGFRIVVSICQRFCCGVSSLDITDRIDPRPSHF